MKHNWHYVIKKTKRICYQPTDRPTDRRTEPVIELLQVGNMKKIAIIYFHHLRKKYETLKSNEVIKLLNVKRIKKYENYQHPSCLVASQLSRGKQRGNIAKKNFLSMLFSPQHSLCVCLSVHRSVCIPSYVHHISLYL